MSFNPGSSGSREFVPGRGLVPTASTFVPGQGMVRTTNPPAQNTNQTYVLQPRVTEAPPPKTQEQKREPVKLVLSEKPAQPQKQDPPKTQAAQPAQPKAVATKSEPAKPKETPKAEPKDDWEQADEPVKPEPKQEPPKKVVIGETGKFTAEGVPIMSLGDDGDDESSEEDAKGETHKEKKKRQEAEAEAQLVANDDPREHVNIVFIGHVDAGKSTISGQVLFSTGMVDLRAIEKFSKEAIEKNRESWFLAYIMDTNEEERAKGKTVEVGRAHFFTEKKRYTILDAPGHKAYVPNMMAGLAQADIGVLIISARKGEFEAGFEKSGQTREHAILAKTIGIKKLIILINKMDDQTVLWSKERYDDISDKLGKFLRGIGFNMKADVLFLPASGLTGINIKNPVTKDVCPWFEGPTLLDALDSLKPLDRMDEAPLRIPVLDKYKESGKTYILGKVETGCLKTGDDIVANPGNVALNVFQIQNEANIITIAKPGENVKIVVKCTQHEEDQIIRGTVISIPTSLCPVTAELVGQVSIFQLLEYKPIFTAGYDCVFHTGTAQEECTVTRLLDQLDPKTGQSIQKLPTFVKENKVVVAHFTLARPMCLEKLADFPQLGRFTLRDEGKTIGFGKVLATNAPIRQKRK